MEAARRIFYERGYEETSLADLAAASGVPKGNFYYHFKSKDDILSVMVDERSQAVQAALEDWRRQLASPLDRLLRFVEMLTREREDLVQYGCPIGTLLTELGKGRPLQQRKARGIYDLYRDWLEEEFVSLGYQTHAASILAIRLLARCQGAVHLAHAYEDARLLEEEVQDICHWLREVAAICGDSTM